MSRYFLESSAFAKLFVLEEGSGALIQLLERVDDGDKLISALAPLEVRSAIRRRERSKDISPDDADRALENVLRECLRIVEQPVTAMVVETACAMLDRHPLRALDALQLATCTVARETLQTDDVNFISSDELLLRAAEAEGFATMNPAKLRRKEMELVASEGGVARRARSDNHGNDFKTGGTSGCESDDTLTS